MMVGESYRDEIQDEELRRDRRALHRVGRVHGNNELRRLLASLRD